MIVSTGSLALVLVFKSYHLKTYENKSKKLIVYYYFFKDIEADPSINLDHDKNSQAILTNVRAMNG